MDVALEDIKKTLHAESVCLPGSLDAQAYFTPALKLPPLFAAQGSGKAAVLEAIAPLITYPERAK
jgi:hypothetical protein